MQAEFLMQSLMPMSEWLVVLWPSLVQQAPSYPAALHTALVCPAVHPATKNPALGSLKSNSALVLGRNSGSSPRAVSDDVLGERYPISGVSVAFKSYSSVLCNFRFRWGNSVQAAGLLDGSEFYSCHSAHHRSLRLPSWAPRYLLPVSILACPGQLFNLLPWCPGLGNHHSLLQP